MIKIKNKANKRKKAEFKRKDKVSVTKKKKRGIFKKTRKISSLKTKNNKFRRNRRFNDSKNIKKGKYINGTFVEGKVIKGKFVAGVFIAGRYIKGRYIKGKYIRGKYRKGRYIKGYYRQSHFLTKSKHLRYTKFNNYLLSRLKGKKKRAELFSIYNKKIRTNQRWGHRSFYYFWNSTLINKKKVGYLKQALLFNKKLSKKGIFERNIKNLRRRLKIEVLSSFFKQKIKQQIIRKYFKSPIKAKRHKVFFLLKAFKKKVKKKVFIVNLITQKRKKLNVNIKRSYPRKHIGFASLKSYTQKTFSKHYFKTKRKSIFEINDIDLVKVLSNYETSTNYLSKVETVINALEGSKERNQINVVNAFQKKLSINKNITKIKKKGVIAQIKTHGIKKVINKKKKKITYKGIKGVKKLVKLKLAFNLLAQTSKLNTHPGLNVALRKALSQGNSFSKVISKLKKKQKLKHKKQRRFFVILRRSFYNFWNKKKFKEKRQHKLIANRIEKRINELNLKGSRQITFKKELNKKFNLVVENFNREKAIVQHNLLNTFADNLRNIQENAIYYMSYKRKRRVKIGGKKPRKKKKGLRTFKAKHAFKYTKVIKKKTKRRLKGKKRKKLKSRNKVLKPYRSKRARRKGHVLLKSYKKVIKDGVIQRSANEKEKAITKAIVTKKSHEIQNEIIIKVILQLLRSKGEVTVENAKGNILNLNNYMLKTSTEAEHLELITYIKAQLVQGYIEKREITRLRELNKELLLNLKAFSRVQIPKERLPEDEFQVLIKKHYKEKKKVTDVLNEMRKNLIIYHLYEETIKENDKKYKIKLPKKRIKVPSLKQIYKGIQQGAKVQKIKLMKKKYGKRYVRNYFYKKRQRQRQKYNKHNIAKRKQQEEKRRRKKLLLKLKQKITIPQMGILKIKIRKRNMFLILCNRRTNQLQEQITARELYYKMSEARNDVQPPEAGKRINRRKIAIKDKGPIGRYISTIHFRLLILSLLFTYRAKYKVLDIEIEKKSRKSIVRIIRTKYWYPFLAQLGVFRRFKFIKNKPHGQMRKKKTKRK